MKAGLFSVRDSATQVYQNIFQAHTNEAAIRSFGDLARDETTNVCKHPDDFILYRIGTWDDDTGTVTGEEPIKLAHARDYHGKTSTETT